MGTPFAVTAANAFMYYHERDIIELYSRNLTLYKRFIDDIFVIWEGSRETLLEFLSAINTKDVRIKITYEISDSKISFLDLLLLKILFTIRRNTLPFRNNLISICIHYESFHPVSNKKAFIRMSLYARNSSTLHPFDETRLLFWRCSRLQGYPARFLLPFFWEINYSTGRNGSLGLIGYRDKGEWYSNPHSTAVMLESKILFLSIYLTLALSLVINLHIC